MCAPAYAEATLGNNSSTSAAAHVGEKIEIAPQGGAQDRIAQLRREFAVEPPAALVAPEHRPEHELAAVGADGLGCLVLDSGLRDMSSLDVAAALRAKSIDLPIILTAAVIDVRLTKDAKRLGIRYVLHKPWDCAELFKLIDEAQGPQTYVLQ